VSVVLLTVLSLTNAGPDCVKSVFENRELRKIFGPKREEVTGG
jgi:hypothetical protein